MPPGAHALTAIVARSPFIPRLPLPTAGATPPPPAPSAPYLAPFRAVSALWRRPMALMWTGVATIHATYLAVRPSGPLDVHGWGMLLDGGMLLFELVIVAQLERESGESQAAQALQARTNELLRQQTALLTEQNALLVTQGALLAAQASRYQNIDDAEQPITQ